MAKSSNVKLAQGQLGGGLGVGQTWKDVLAERALDTTYYNATGKPILVRIGVSFTGGSSRLWVDSFSFIGTAPIGPVIIPPGSSYKFDTYGLVTDRTVLRSWQELS